MADGEITLGKIVDAHERMAPPVRVTPILPVARSSGEVGRERLFLKAENLQVTGSYKARAAFHILRSLDDERRRRGIVMSSSGNFAQAFAYAGPVVGSPVAIVMPDYTADVKVQSTRDYGAQVVLCPTFADRDPTVERVAAEQGMIALHSFEDPEVPIGHAGIGLEILEQVPDVETVLIPISSGGLAAGIAVAIKENRPDVAVLGVQPEGGNAAYVSWQAGEVRTIEHWDSMADALSGRRPGVLPFRYLQRYLDDILLVTEEAMIPISSGGLAAGIAVAIKENRPDVKVLGVQPEGGNAAYVSWQAGEVRTIEHWDSMADALSGRRPGALPFRYLQRYLDDILLVTEEAIAEAVRTILFRTKTLAEPGGATAAAAFLDGLVDNDRVTVAIASGGNIQPVILEKILAGTGGG